MELLGGIIFMVLIAISVILWVFCVPVAIVVVAKKLCNIETLLYSMLLEEVEAETVDVSTVNPEEE